MLTFIKCMFMYFNALSAGYDDSVLMKTSQLTDESSEQEAIMLSMKGFHLISNTLPW